MSKSSFNNSDPAKLRRCSFCSVRHTGICSAITAEELEQLNGIATIRRYKAGDVILSEEAPVDSYANIISGMLKLAKSTRDGREQIVALLFPSDFFGRVYGLHANHGAIALTDVELCTYPRASFEHFLQSHPDMEHRLFKDVLNELDAAEDWMLLLGRKNALEKLSTFLLMLEKRLAKWTCPHEHQDVEGRHIVDQDGLRQIHLPMTRADIADHLGLTTETVCRQMTHLRQGGAIILPDNHSFVVKDHAMLVELAG